MNSTICNGHFPGIDNFHLILCSIIKVEVSEARPHKGIIVNKKIYPLILIVTITLLGYLQDSTTNSAVQDIIIFIICFVFALLFLNKSVGWKIVVTIVFLLMLTFSNMLLTYGITSIADISVEQLCSPGTIRLFL